jgi:hypothetical protein
MPTRLQPGRTTLPITVKNTGFLLDRLGEDCHPLQFLRELTTNSIEAILRTSSKTGEIIWDADWITFDLDHVFKLSITDNGDGMRGQDMVEYINQLSSSAVEQSLSGNYGVGGKIATATRNHHGVMYLSWRNGLGSLIHFWKDPASGTYGLKQFETASGDYSHYVMLEDEVRPEIISDHGTKIVLLGHANAQDTMQPPGPDTPSPSRWISKYLNTRYFRIPEGISIRAREGWQNPRTDKDRNLLRKVIGQEAYLREHAQESGRVILTGATAHWWILEDEVALTNNSGFIESAGHVAALYQDELYELTNSRAGTARLQNFGVVFGYRQVVIYVEPVPDNTTRLTTNTARTNLLLNNEQLPWADWASEFREKMPSKISELIAEKAATSSSLDHGKSIRDRLKPFLDLFKVSRYRPAPNGTISIDDQITVRGGHPKRASAATSGAPSSGQSGGEGGTAGGVYAIFQKEGGKPGEKVHPDPFPEVKWISVRDGSRVPGDLEDRAAKFLGDQNLLLINSDFRVFADMVKKFVKDYGGNPALADKVEDSVQAWFGQALIETVIGVQALHGAKEWAAQDIQAALSEEALTAVVMPRYHVHNSVKRELGSKFGKTDAA